MLKKEHEVYDIIDNIMEERNVTEENKKNCNKEESINSVDNEPEVSEPFETSIPDQEQLKESYEPIVNADLVPQNGDLDKDTVPIHQIESQSLDSCYDALAVVLPENDEEKIKSATLPCLLQSLKQSFPQN